MLGFAINEVEIIGQGVKFLQTNAIISLLELETKSMCRNNILTQVTISQLSLAIAHAICNATSIWLRYLLMTLKKVLMALF